MSQPRRNSKNSRKRSIRQQIRDNRRLLAKDDLPETVRDTKSRVLSMLLEEEYKRQKDNKEKKILKKYKMVKFFEKRKICRRLKTLLEEFSSNPDSVTDDIQQLRGDLNYIMYYPLNEKYFSLYPKSKTSDQSLSQRACVYQQILNDVKDGVHKDGLLTVCPLHITDKLPPIDTTILPLCDDEQDTTILPLCDDEQAFVKETKLNQDKDCSQSDRVDDGHLKSTMATKRTLVSSKKDTGKKKFKRKLDTVAKDCLLSDKKKEFVSVCDREGIAKKIEKDSFFL